MSDEPTVSAAPVVEEDDIEIVIDLTDDNDVRITQGDWTCVLSIEEARLLADALENAAEDAESEAS